MITNLILYFLLFKFLTAEVPRKNMYELASSLSEFSWYLIFVGGTCNPQGVI